MKKSGIKKFFKWFGIIIGSIIIIGIISTGVVWRNQITSVSTLKQINDKKKNYPFYTMKYNGDYGFDHYLKVGSKNNIEYLRETYNEAAHGLGGIAVKQAMNCASFTATAPNGDKLFARNLDTTEAMPLYLTTKPSNGNKSMSMVNLMELGYGRDNLPKVFSTNIFNILGASYYPLEGMNEHGVAISVLTAGGSKSTIKENKITLNEYGLMRMVLDKASTVQEAVKMIKNYNMGYINPASHFMIADATGASTVVEYVDGELHTVNSDEHYQVVTNFVLYNNPNGGFGIDRYNRIKAKLKETEGVLTEKEAMKLLSENTIKGDEQWSVVYNLTKKKAYICVGKDYKTIREFKLN